MEQTFYKFFRPMEALGGIIMFSLGVNLFITPVNLYNGGVLGICQRIRSCLTLFGNFSFGGMDIAGILYYLFNVPLFFLAFQGVSRRFCLHTLICVSLTTLFLSFIPIPPHSLLPNDTLGSCLFGGLMCGAGLGLTLHAGASLGGTDIIGVYLIKKGSNFSVGRVNLFINLFLYLACFLIFDIATALYSIVYSAVMSLTMDMVHTQNINMEVLIISKGHADEITHALTSALTRGVTRWHGAGGYTNDQEDVLYSVMSKYEIPQMHRIVEEIDPRAFVVVKGKAHVYGNYLKKL